MAQRITENKRNFALAYFEEKNATAAYLRAYSNFSGKRETAKKRAHELLHDPTVLEELARLRKQIETPRILKLSELGEFWSQIIQDGGADIKSRISASKALAQYAFRVFEKNKGEPEDTAILSVPQAEDFAEFCERAGYPRPFAKQTEMAHFVLEDGPGLLLGSRGYGKTDYCIICYLAFCLVNDPTRTFLVLTKERERGVEILGEIARILKENGVQLEKDSAARIVIAGHKNKDPNVAVLPLRSKSFRGRHPQHILCDDLITPDDVSNAERDRVEAVRAELMKLTQNVCFIGQPAHAKDVYAKLRKLPGVRLMEVPYGMIPQLDHDLEAQRAAGVSEASIQASYFLQIAESERMPFAGLEYVPFFPAGSSAGFVDPSHMGNDYTAFAVGAMNFDNFVVCGFAWPRAWDDCLEEIVSVSKALNCQKFAFETNGVGKHPVLMLRKNGARVAEWRSDTNKHGRILNAAGFREHIKLCNWLPPALQQSTFREAQQAFNNMVVDYEYKAEHDDAPDALANLMMYLGMVKK